MNAAAAAAPRPPFFPTTRPSTPSAPSPSLPPTGGCRRSSSVPRHRLTINSLTSSSPTPIPATTAAASSSPTTLLTHLGITGPALHRLLSRRPDILSSPETAHFLHFLLHNLPGIKPTKLHRLLISTPPHLLPRFTATVSLLLHHAFPPHHLAHLTNSVDTRKVFFQKPLTELEQTIHFLAPYGWPDLIVRRPALLNLDLHSQLRPRVHFISNLGQGDEDAARRIINKLPAILAYTVEHFESHIAFWRSVGLSDEQVFRIVLIYPNVFSVSRDNKLRPRVEFLTQCGMDTEDVFKFLIKAPLFLSLSSEENLSKKMALLVKLGYRHRTREMALAVGAVTRTSCENMQAVIGVFFDYGLSGADVLAMSKKHPQVLQYGSGSLEKKIEFLVEEMERDVGELLVFPAFLGYKLDERIKKRYEAKMKTRGKGMSLNKLLSVSNKKFVLADEELQGSDSVEL